MAFNQTRAGAPNSAAGRAAEAVENRTGPNSGIGRAAGNFADREEMKHGTTGTAAGLAGTRGMTGTGVTGHHTGTGLTGHHTGAAGFVEREELKHGMGAGGRMVRDEQYDREALQGVTGIRSETTGQGAAYCPNPNDSTLPKEFETRVQVIEKVPEMKTVTKTDYVKRLDERTETVMVPKTKVVMEEVERVDMVPHVKEVPKTRTETRHRVVEEQVQVPYTEKVVVNVPVPRKETIPRVVTEQVETTVTVPIVKEVPVTRKVEVPTGNYCENPVNEFHHAGKGLPTGLHGEKLGHHTGLNKDLGAHRSTAVGTGVGTGVLARGGSSSSSGYSSSDDETHKRTGLTGTHATTGMHTTTGTGLAGTHTGTTAAAPKKKSLLQKIEDKLMPGHH